ncbi:MAG: hypothetical protein ABSD29_03265 [Verrucomicrobiota bacterium]
MKIIQSIAAPTLHTPMWPPLIPATVFRAEVRPEARAFYSEAVTRADSAGTTSDDAPFCQGYRFWGINE